MARVVSSDSYSSATYTIIIRHYANGGDTAPSNVSKSGSSSSKSVTIKGNISSTLPTRNGYRFIGYAKSSGGSVVYQPGNQVSYTFSRSATYSHQTSYQEGDVIYVTNHYTCANQSQYINLYAKWEAAGSTVTASDGTLGTQQTLTINKADPSYTHTLRYSFAGQTGTIAENVDSSYNWTPPLSLADYIPSAESGACTIYCDTYDGSTLYSTSQTSIILSVPASVKCTISAVTLTDTDTSVATKFSAFVQGKSAIQVAGTFVQGSGSPTYGATVASVSVNINGQTLVGNNAITSVLQTSGTNAYSVTITDTRGRTDTYTSTFNVLPYTSPSISATAERNATTNSAIDVSYTWTISAVSNLNDKTITITLELADGTYVDEEVVTPGTYTGSGTYQFTGTDISDQYNVIVEVEDFFGSAQTTSAIPAVGSRIYHISATDKTIARHGANPEDGADHQFFDEVFHGATEHKGKVVLSNGQELGKSLWSNSSGWNSGSIQVADFSKYTYFAVRVASYDIKIICMSDGTHFRGAGGYAANSTNVATMYINCTYSGDNLSWGYCASFNRSGNGQGLKITEIIGLF